jgi:hypothetical protein
MPGVATVAVAVVLAAGTPGASSTPESPYLAGPQIRISRGPAAVLTIHSAVDYGRQSASVIAPELSITTPDGRRAGFDRSTGGEWNELPGSAYVREASSEDSEDPSDTGGPRNLGIPSARDGTYLLEVTGTTTGEYLLDIVAEHLSHGARSATTRKIQDVAMEAGEVHRYHVQLGRESDGAVRLVVTREGGGGARAPLRGPAQDALFFSVGADCGGGTPVSIRVTLPDGRSATDGPAFGPPTGTLPDDQILDSGDERHDRHLHVSRPRDGEYVVEIAVTGSPTPYFLHANFVGDGMDVDSWPWDSPECSKRVIAPGTVHRWTFRLRREAAAPLRVGGPHTVTTPSRPTP